MPFLRLNGWPVLVESGSATQKRQVLGPDATSEQGAPIFYRKRPVLGWDARSRPLIQADADALEGLVAGLGHRFPFDTNLFSTRGRGPLSIAGAAIVAGGVFGGFCASVTSVVYDMARGIAPLLDRWTIIAFREEAGIFRHYVVRSDGAVFFEGVRDDTMPVASWLSVFDGFVSLLGAPTRFDELVVLSFVANDDQCLAWASRMRDERIPFSSLPRLDADGDLFGGRSLEVIGSVDSAQRIVSFSDGTALPDGVNFWRNNGRRVPFRLDQARAAPRIDIPHPEAFFSFEPSYFSPPVDMSIPRATFGISGVVDATEGQAGQGGAFRGVLDGYLNTAGGTFDREDTDAFGISAAVRVDETAVVGTVMTIYGKISVTVIAGLWFTVTRNANGMCTVEVWLRNAAGTLGRRFTAVDAFRFGEWHHVVASYDGRADAAGMALYVDGARVGGVTMNTAPGVTTNVLPARIGRQSLPANVMVGDLDEVGFWLVQLTASDAYQLFRAASQQRTAQFFAE